MNETIQHPNNPNRTIDSSHYLHPEFVVPQLPDLTPEQKKREPQKPGEIHPMYLLLAHLMQGK